MQRCATFYTFAKSKLAFVPPKPKELEIAKLISLETFSFAARSTRVDTAGLSKLIVGGATWSRIAKVVKMASIAPAAPNK